MTFPTNVRTCPEVTGHDCAGREDKPNTAEAAAAGAAGGLAAGTAGGLAVTAAAPAALGAVGFTGSGVAGGSIAATLQGLLYAGATPAGGWFATCTSAAMGGAMGAAAVTAVAATGGAAVAAGAGYGIYKLIKKSKLKSSSCPWCTGGECKSAILLKQGTSKNSDKKKTEKVTDDSLMNEQEMFERAIALSLASFELEMVGKEACRIPASQVNEGNIATPAHEKNFAEATENNIAEARAEFECPVCAEVMSPPAHIWQCGDGHILCQNCRNHPEVRNCPECRGKIVGRNLAMERVAERVFK